MRYAWLLLVLGCTGPGGDEPDPGPDAPGLLGDGDAEGLDRGWLNPFPSAHVIDEEGFVALPEIVPFEGGTPIPVQEQAWRTGFSPAQSTVIHLDEVDPATLPSWHSPTPGVGGAVLADLTTNEWLPCMAELDAFPEIDHPSLIIRPLVALTPGHRVGVAITTDVTPRPQRFDDLISGSPAPSLEDYADHYTDLVDQLETMGAEDIAIAWDFPVGDGTRPLTTALEQYTLPDTWTFDRIRNADEGDNVPPYTWRIAEGTFDVTDFLVDDWRLQRDETGGVSPQGTAAAELYVHIPDSVKDAEPGSVPVMIFGHGILSMPSNYLGKDDDPSGVLRVAEEGGFIVVASTWRGLTWNDRADAVQAANDIGQLPMVPDRLVQGVVNAHTLAELVLEGSLLEDDIFRGADNQLLADDSQLLYYGISLGGIEGGVLMGTDAPIDAAVLHVPGASWSTMLERSSNWTAFDLFVTATVESAQERQLLYALSQLWWDPADPINYAETLGTRTVLLQESKNDEQVPNMTTRMLARSAGLEQMSPLVEPVFGVDDFKPPAPAGSRGLVQFDPGKDPPPDINRPAPITKAHDVPRVWPGTRAQILDFLDPDAPGTITHHCGDKACAVDNVGEGSAIP